MKSLLAICTLFLAAAVVRAETEQDVEKFMEATKEHFAPCIAEAGLPTDLPTMMSPPSMSPEQMDKMNCVHACVMKRLGIMDGGKLIADKMVEFTEKTFPEEAAKLAKNSESCIEEANGAGEECGVMRSFIECIKKFD